MSKLDLTLQDETFVKINQMHKNLLNNNENFPHQEGGIDSSNKMDIDLQVWMEIFEEDQVLMEGCR